MRRTNRVPTGIMSATFVVVLAMAMVVLGAHSVYSDPRPTYRQISCSSATGESMKLVAHRPDDWFKVIEKTSNLLVVGDSAGDSWAYYMPPSTLCVFLKEKSSAETHSHPRSQSKRGDLSA